MSTNTKHTPGPWRAVDHGPSHSPWAAIAIRPVVLGAIAQLTIGRVVKHGIGDRGQRLATQEDKANAAIMEAAPELLAVLRRAFEYLDNIPETSAGGDDEAVLIARAAKAVIKQAMGGAA